MGWESTSSINDLLGDKLAGRDNMTGFFLFLLAIPLGGTTTGFSFPNL